jgi:hypothetical protein
MNATAEAEEKLARWLESELGKRLRLAQDLSEHYDLSEFIVDGTFNLRELATALLNSGADDRLWRSARARRGEIAAPRDPPIGDDLALRLAERQPAGAHFDMQPVLNPVFQMRVPRSGIGLRP